MMIQLKKTDSLYQQIASYFEQEIAEGRLNPGDKIPATTKLASRFQVNADTIQQSLKLLMRRGLVERAPGRGTFVRQGIGSKTIGVIFGKEIYYNPDVVFFSHFLDRITRIFEENGWNFKLFPTRETPTFDKAFYELKSAVSSGEVRAVIEFCSNELIKGWLAAECPVPYSLTPIHTDYRDFTLKGLDYLFSRGCRRVAFLAHVLDHNEDLYHRTIREYCAAHAVDPDRVTLSFCDPHAIEGYNAVKNLFRGEPRPDGLLAGNDGVFRGALYAMLELGLRIPEEVKVMTHTNRGIDIFCHIPLTCLEFNPDDYALQVYDEVIARLDGRKAEYTMVKPRLVAGKSCGE